MAIPNPSTLVSPQRTASLTSTPPNITNVVLGNLHFRPWYPSFYPEDMIGGKRTERLYVCQWCFRYTVEIWKFCAHCKVCPLKDEAPPGDVVYEKNELQIRQVDGEDWKLYSQNLSLFAKLFLETKSVFFDSSTFLYYTLVMRDDASPRNGQVVGFFSKEKMSWDNNNLACIVIFPPWQKRGLGQILIAASYVLGKREGRFGGPERPLSAPGRKGYSAFWCGEVVRFVLRTQAKQAITIQEMSQQTYIMAEDIVAALNQMDVADKRKTGNGRVVINKEKVRKWAEGKGVNDHALVDEEGFAEEMVEEEEESDESES